MAAPALKSALTPTMSRRATAAPARHALQARCARASAPVTHGGAFPAAPTDYLESRLCTCLCSSASRRTRPGPPAPSTCAARWRAPRQRDRWREGAVQEAPSIARRPLHPLPALRKWSVIAFVRRGTCMRTSANARARADRRCRLRAVLPAASARRSVLRWLRTPARYDAGLGRRASRPVPPEAAAGRGRLRRCGARRGQPVCTAARGLLLVASPVRLARVRRAPAPNTHEEAACGRASRLIERAISKASNSRPERDTRPTRSRRAVHLRSGSSMCVVG